MFMIAQYHNGIKVLKYSRLHHGTLKCHVLWITIDFEDSFSHIKVFLHRYTCGVNNSFFTCSEAKEWHPRVFGVIEDPSEIHLA